MHRTILAVAAWAAIAWTALSEQGAASGPVAIVSTARELIEAVDRGTKHVRVTSHLDLRHQDGLTSDDFALFYNPKLLMSMTVSRRQRCGPIECTACWHCKSCTIFACHSDHLLRATAAQHPQMAHHRVVHARPQLVNFVLLKSMQGDCQEAAPATVAECGTADCCCIAAAGMSAALRV